MPHGPRTPRCGGRHPLRHRTDRHRATSRLITTRGSVGAVALVAFLRSGRSSAALRQGGALVGLAGLARRQRMV